MLVTVLKEHYVVVLSEDQKDDRWLKQVGYDELGEEYYQEVFKDFDDFLSEVKYLIQYGAKFDDTDGDESPSQIIKELKEEDFL